MNHKRVKHYVSIAGIIALLLFGGAYLFTAESVSAEIVALIVTGIAGLGGYNLAQREDTSRK
jgi:hypothetical protein